MHTQITQRVGQKVVDSLMQHLRPLGVSHFYYAIVPKEESELIKNIGRSAKYYFGNMASQKKMRFAVASDKTILDYREDVISRFSKLDRKFIYAIPAFHDETSAIYFPIVDLKSIPLRYVNSIEQLRGKYHIRSAATSYHSIGDNGEWIGIFHLFSCLEHQEFKTGLSPSQKKVISILQEYSDLFVAVAHQDINPIANFGLLSSSCVKILEMAAEGDSSEEIGKKLFLTERGVNYHLDRARDILGARNRTNLVSKAYKKGIL